MAEVDVLVRSQSGSVDAASVLRGNWWEWRGDALFEFARVRSILPDHKFIGYFSIGSESSETWFIAGPKLRGEREIVCRRCQGQR